MAVEKYCGFFLGFIEGCRRHIYLGYPNEGVASRTDSSGSSLINWKPRPSPRLESARQRCNVSVAHSIKAFRGQRGPLAATAVADDGTIGVGFDFLDFHL